MRALVAAGGGRAETVHGPAGVGDLHVTAAAGRNRAFGERVGAGRPAREVAAEMLAAGELTEGYPAIATAWRFARERGVAPLPLLAALHAIAWEGADGGRDVEAVRRRVVGGYFAGGDFDGSLKTPPSCGRGDALAHDLVRLVLLDHGVEDGHPRLRRRRKDAGVREAVGPVEVRLPGRLRVFPLLLSLLEVGRDEEDSRVERRVLLAHLERGATPRRLGVGEVPGRELRLSQQVVTERLVRRALDGLAIRRRSRRRSRATTYLALPCAQMVE